MIRIKNEPKFTINNTTMAVIFIFVGCLIVDFVQIYFNSDKILLVTWGAIFLGVYLLLPYIDITLKKLNMVQKIWIIFQIYIILVTIFNALINTSNAYGLIDLTIACMMTYILPCFACMQLAGQKQIVVWVTIYKYFVAFCSLIGIFELLTKIQIYSGLISSKLAILNQQIYGIPGTPGYRLTLFFYHPIYFSMILAIGIICCLYVPFKNKIVNYGIIVFMAINIVFTKSRTGWIITVIGVIFYLYGKWNIEGKINSRKLLRLIMGVICVIAVVIGIIYFSDRTLWDKLFGIIMERINELFSAKAYGARIANLGIIGEVIKSNENYIFFFGGGEKYAITYLQTHTFIDSWSKAIDNQFVTILLNFGVIGLCMYVAIFVLSIKNYFKYRKMGIKALPFVLLIVIIIASFAFEPMGLNIIGALLNVIIALTITKSEESYVEEKVANY